ncbi:MAG: penicillin acylase family protein [Pseudomonas sp.]
MRKLLGRLLLALVLLAATAVLAAYLMLRGSLPSLHGEQHLPGLAAPVRIERDALGVVTIDAASEADAMRALGYVHAQERFFEMDLMRRAPAGELAALFGPAALDIDKQMRVHRLRARVQAQLSQSLGGQRQVLEAYRDGVNAGLGRLHVRPWAYLLLRQRPRPWTLDDSVLTGLAMYADLQDPRNQRELALARIRAVVPPALYALLAHDGSEWDAALFGEARGNVVLPDAATLDLRSLDGRQRDTAATSALTPPPAPQSVPLSPAGRERGLGWPPAVADFLVGSNNFAVDGTLTADGRAIVADDMHLALRAPNIWFRARLRYPDPRAPGGRVDVTGFTLPGIPAVIVGSNGHVAWGFTNSYIDTADFARISADAVAGAVTTHDEVIEIAGADPARLPVRETAWGPIVGTDPDGSLLALRWTAQLPGAVKFDLIDMARTGNLEEAFAVADRAGIPAQNLILADSSGRIAWRLAGTRPDRAAGCAPDALVAAAAPHARSVATAPCPPWPLLSDRAPVLADPASHRLWTANNRIVDGETLAIAGNGGYDLGARAKQIRDDLFAKDRFTEADLLAIQLDDRALLLERWWKLLRQVVEPSDDPALRRLEAATRHWDGRAAVDSASYRIVRGFRGMTLDAIEAGLLAPAKARLGDAYLPPRLAQLEGVAWPLLSQRPANLLPPPYASWDNLLADVARNLEKDLAAQGPALSARTWGERNTTAICHPVARALPAFARPLLCMPAEALPGDRDMPRVQGPAFGASERMVVSPGHEADGIVHMPGGQSGHPLSPFWGAGHEDWARGRATPFLPGPARYTLTLRPR